MKTDAAEPTGRPARRRSLALRLAGYVAAAALVLAVLGSGLFIYVDYLNIRREIEVELPRQLPLLRSAAAQAALQKDHGLALAVTEGLLQRTGIVAAALIDSSGAILADNRLFPMEGRSRAVSDALFGPPRDLTIPLRHTAAGGGEVGRLVLTVDSLDFAREFMRRAAQLAAYGFFVVFGISLVLYGITYFVVARPLARVARTLTATEGAADIATQLPEFAWHRPDELGLLVQAVNTLCRVIERTVGDLRMRDRALGAITQGIVIADAGSPGYPTIHVNEAFQRITGYSAAEVLGRSCSLLQGPETDGRTVSAMRQALSSGQPFQGELLNYRKDGSTFWNLLSISPVHDERGGLRYFIAVQTDVTERQQLEMQLRQAQKMEAVGQLTGGVAHDFNNLLTVILGNAELLAERLDGREGGRMAQMIQEMALRGADLTQRLLAFARRQALQPSRIDVGALLLDAAPVLQRTLGEAIVVETRLEPELWPALVDASQLQTALLNLAINARDAMPRGGHLAIAASNVVLGDRDLPEQEGESPIAAGQYVMIAVSDDGTGMPADVRRRAFEPFFTTKEVGQGSGLGLSMVYGFVSQSGGHLRIESEVGRGTTVRMYVPRAVGTYAAGVPESEDAELPRGAGERVLVVEDNEQVRAHVEAVLLDLGYDVVTAQNGVDALALVGGDQGFALMFSDVVMPGGVDGVELAQRARQMRPGLKVLLTSGYPETALANHTGGAWLPDLLMKPYRRAELARRIRALLDR